MHFHENIWRGFFHSEIFINKKYCVIWKPINLMSWDQSKTYKAFLFCLCFTHHPAFPYWLAVFPQKRILSLIYSLISPTEALPLTTSKTSVFPHRRNCAQLKLFSFALVEWKTAVPFVLNERNIQTHYSIDHAHFP